MKGWVYIISNEDMPGLVKIGYSMKTPELRAAELDSTGSAQPYEVDYQVLVDEPREIEKAAHRLLRDRHWRKEWFRCPLEEAICAIQSAVGSGAVFEEFNRADRAKVEAIRRIQGAKERIRLAADAKRREIFSRYEVELKPAPEKVSWFWRYLGSLAVGVIAVVAMALTDLNVVATIIIIIIAFSIQILIIKGGYEEGIDRAAILAKRDAELAALEGDASRQLKNLETVQPLDAQIKPTAPVKLNDKCPHCGHMAVQRDLFLGVCDYCKRTVFNS